LVYLPGFGLFGLFSLVSVVASSDDTLSDDALASRSWQVGPQQPWSRSLQAGHWIKS